MNGTAEKFDYQENEEIKELADSHFKGRDKLDHNYSPGYEKLYYAVAKQSVETGSQFAGSNLLAKPIQGDDYVRRSVEGGGTLVAVLNGKRVRRMYYTDEVARPFFGRPQDNYYTVATEKDGKTEYKQVFYSYRIDVRAFREIPLEWAKDSRKIPSALRSNT